MTGLVERGDDANQKRGKCNINYSPLPLARNVEHGDSEMNKKSAGDRKCSLQKLNAEKSKTIKMNICNTTKTIYDIMRNK